MNDAVFCKFLHCHQNVLVHRLAQGCDIGWKKHSLISLSWTMSTSGWVVALSRSRRAFLGWLFNSKFFSTSGTNCLQNHSIKIASDVQPLFWLLYQTGRSNVLSFILMFLKAQGFYWLSYELILVWFSSHCVASNP